MGLLQEYILVELLSRNCLALFAWRAVESRRPSFPSLRVRPLSKLDNGSLTKCHLDDREQNNLSTCQRQASHDSTSQIHDGDKTLLAGNCHHMDGVIDLKDREYIGEVGLRLTNPKRAHAEWHEMSASFVMHLLPRNIAPLHHLESLSRFWMLPTRD